jgi:hypothetical protein
MTANGRFCCKSLFALVIKNSPGRRRDFRVKMWGTSSPDDKLTGDLGNVIEVMSIDGRGSDCLAAKISIRQFGTFATISALNGQTNVAAMQPAEADIWPLDGNSRFDPKTVIGQHVMLQ